MKDSNGASVRRHTSITRGVFSRERSAIRLTAAILAGMMLLPLSACGGSDTDVSALSSESASTSATPSESASPSETPQSSESGSGDASSPSDGNAGASNASGAAVDMLATLPVKGRAPKTGYARTQFGAAWSDVDHNGCDTRNDILKRDMTNVTFKPGTHDCVVKTGTLNDPYTGKTINFVRGQHTSTAVQIDHVVALSDAWQKGAQQLNADQRLQLANDPYNLLAVDGPANQQKSDSDAASWLPSNKSFRCQYVARQIGVKHKYALWVTQAEKDAMTSVLSGCPGQTVPDGGGVVASAQADSQPAQTPEPAQTTQAAPAPAQTQAAPAPAPAQQSGGDVYYQNCSAVRAAGKAPLYQGQPGYSRKLDRDGDGVACE
ncbi:GmrSD restriction endonuclease domain-containing protein [Bifidobacterium boum]|uniref:GmrSD restriction endonuclease domain-containing protein n=1 Tax=Bifidobacterium boum TaxID=78343 RepID=UPI002430D9B6|nr:DUF1524 domain-containing protein [Bifidobacterium boum]MCI5862204.1 DUF1524 domain-containing protein [Bifidobacterium boum]